MKTLREKLEEKLEKQHADLEKSIKWLGIRRYASASMLILSIFAMHSAGFDAGTVVFMFFTLPLLIVYGLQTNKLSKRKAELAELEKTILHGKT